MTAHARQRLHHCTGTLLAVSFAVLITWSDVSARGKITVESAGSRIEISRVELDEVDYVSLPALVEVLGGTMAWDSRRNIVSAQLEGRHWRFELHSPFVAIDDNVHGLVFPLRMFEGDLVAPIWPLARLLDQAGSRTVAYDTRRHRLTLAPRGHSIVDYEIKPRTNGLLVEVVLAEPLRYEAYLSEGNWVNLTIQNGRLNTSELSRRAPHRLVREVVAYQFETSAQLSFRFRGDPSGFRTATTQGPDRIQIIIDDPGFVPESPVGRAEFEAAPNPIDLIVIDPGHGGHDDGARGRKKKTKEKDVVLKIAKELKKLLERDGFRVILTRKKDRFVALTERTRIANEAGADLFVSIHANASKKSKPRGCQTFFLARALNDEARAAAMLENSALQYEAGNDEPVEVNDVEHILLDMIQGEFQKESSDLADMIQTRFERTLNIPSRGVDQAGFVVLNKAYMPAVLVETAFISNVKDEALLRKGSFRKTVARSVRDGIRDFKRKYDRTVRAESDDS